MTYNAHGKTFTFPITLNKKAYYFTSQFGYSAYVVFIENRTLSSCSVTNFQGHVGGDLLIIGY